VEYFFHNFKDFLMFKLPALLFAVFMGLFMSLTITFCLSLYLIGFQVAFIGKFLELWPLAYPIAVISIIFYRPLVLMIVGNIIKTLNMPK
jgi:hypothetical protein